MNQNPQPQAVRMSIHGPTRPDPVKLLEDVAAKWDEAVDPTFFKWYRVNLPERLLKIAKAVGIMEVEIRRLRDFIETALAVGTTAAAKEGWTAADLHAALIDRAVAFGVLVPTGETGAGGRPSVVENWKATTERNPDAALRSLTVPEKMKTHGRADDEDPGSRDGDGDDRGPHPRDE